VLCLGYKSRVIKHYFLDYHVASSDVRVDLRTPDAVHVLGSATDEGWEVTLAETGLDAMTGCRVKRVEKYITGDTFLLTYGDGVSDVDIPSLLAFHRRHGRLATVTAVRPPSRFGEIELDGDRVVEFDEKPVTARGCINGGFFVLDRRLFGRLPDDPGLVFEQAPLKELARDGELMAYRHEGFWQPMDSSRDHKYLNELWKSGHAPWKTWDVTRLRVAA
jgi:glucose-1-phosphate cytidylyltransferase